MVIGLVGALLLLRFVLNRTELTGFKVSPSTVRASPKSATTAVKSYKVNIEIEYLFVCIYDLFIYLS